jgi:hypothetical protein
MKSKAREFYKKCNNNLGKAYFDNVDKLHNAIEWLQAFQDFTGHHDMVLENTSDRIEREEVLTSEARILPLKN